MKTAPINTVWMGPSKHPLLDQPYRVELELQAAAALLIFASNHF